MSVVIIGGADGPTSVFVTSTRDLLLLKIGVVTVICSVAFLVFCKMKKRKK